MPVVDKMKTKEIIKYRNALVMILKPFRSSITPIIKMSVVQIVNDNRYAGTLSLLKIIKSKHIIIDKEIDNPPPLGVQTA